jgi:hypothetical protein
MWGHPEWFTSIGEAGSAWLGPVRGPRHGRGRRNRDWSSNESGGVSLIDVDLANSYHGGMPRHRRLNAIHHVITRGLNRQDIFLDDCDRNDFLGRLEKNLPLTGCCLSVQVIDPLGI